MMTQCMMVASQCHVAFLLGSLDPTIGFLLACFLEKVVSREFIGLLSFLHLTHWYFDSKCALDNKIRY